MGQGVSKRASYTPGQTKDAGLPTPNTENGDVKQAGGANGQVELISNTGIVTSTDDVTPTSSSPNTPSASTSPADKKKKKKPKFTFSLKRTGSGKRARSSKETNGIRPSQGKRPTSYPQGRQPDGDGASGQGQRPQSLFMEEPIAIPEDDGKIEVVSLSSNEDKEREKKNKDGGEDVPAAAAAAAAPQPESPKDKKGKKKDSKKKKSSKKKKDKELKEAKAKAEKQSKAEAAKADAPKAEEKQEESSKVEDKPEAAAELPKDEEKVVADAAATLENAEVKVEAAAEVKVDAAAEVKVDAAEAEQEQPKEDDSKDESADKEVEKKEAENQTTEPETVKTEITHEQFAAQIVEATLADVHMKLEADGKQETPKEESADAVNAEQVESGLSEAVGEKAEEDVQAEPEKTEDKAVVEIAEIKVELTDKADDVKVEESQPAPAENSETTVEVPEAKSADDSLQAAVEACMVDMKSDQDVVKVADEPAAGLEAEIKADVQAPAHQEPVVEITEASVQPPAESSGVKVEEVVEEVEQVLVPEVQLQVESVTKDDAEKPAEVSAPEAEDAGKEKEPDNKEVEAKEDNVQEKEESPKTVDQQAEGAAPAAAEGAEEKPSVEPQPAEPGPPPLSPAERKAKEKELKAAKKREEKEKARLAKEEKKRLKEQKKREAKEKKQREKELKEQAKAKAKALQSAKAAVKVEEQAKEVVEEAVVASQGVAAECQPSTSAEIKQEVEVEVSDKTPDCSASPAAGDEENAGGKLGNSVKEIISSIEGSVVKTTPPGNAAKPDSDEPPAVPDSPYPDEDGEQPSGSPTSPVSPDSSVSESPVSSVPSSPMTPEGTPVSPETGESARSSVLRRIELGPRLKTAILRKSSGAADNSSEEKRVSLTQPRHVEVSDLTPPPRKHRPRRPLEQVWSPMGRYSASTSTSPATGSEKTEPAADTKAPESSEQTEKGAVDEAEAVAVVEEQMQQATVVSANETAPPAAPEKQEESEETAAADGKNNEGEYKVADLPSPGSRVSIHADPESPTIVSTAQIVLTPTEPDAPDTVPEADKPHQPPVVEEAEVKTDVAEVKADASEVKADAEVTVNAESAAEVPEVTAKGNDINLEKMASNVVAEAQQAALQAVTEPSKGEKNSGDTDTTDVQQKTVTEDSDITPTDASSQQQESPATDTVQNGEEASKTEQPAAEGSQEDEKVNDLDADHDTSQLQQFNKNYYDIAVVADDEEEEGTEGDKTVVSLDDTLVESADTNSQQTAESDAPHSQVTVSDKLSNGPCSEQQESETVSSESRVSGDSEEASRCNGTHENSQHAPDSNETIDAYLRLQGGSLEKDGEQKTDTACKGDRIETNNNISCEQQRSDDVPIVTITAASSESVD